jgi:hypothetical protein
VASTKKTTALVDRRRRVAEAYLRGLSQYKIAEAEGVNHGQISRDLAVVREEWKAAASLAFGEHVAQQLAKLDKLERTYWEAWERSKRTATAATQPASTTAMDLDGSPVPGNLDAETGHDRPGDPRFLAGVESCIDRRCRILGLYCQRIEHGGSLNVGVVVIEVEKDEDNASGALPTYPSTGGRVEVVPVSRNGSGH